MSDLTGLAPGDYNLDDALPFIPRYDDETASATLIVSFLGHGWCLSRCYLADDGTGYEQLELSLIPLHESGASRYERLTIRDYPDYDAMAAVAERIWHEFATYARER